MTSSFFLILLKRMTAMTTLKVSLPRLIQATTTASILIISGLRSMVVFKESMNNISCSQDISMREEQASQAMLLQDMITERMMLVLARSRLRDTIALARVEKVSSSRVEERTSRVDMG